MRLQIRALRAGCRAWRARVRGRCAVDTVSKGLGSTAAAGEERPVFGVCGMRRRECAGFVEGYSACRAEAVGSEVSV